MLLTCTAGAVDATTYLQLDRVFVANMTGNTVLLALRVGGVDPSAAVGNFIALVGFCAGALLATVLLGESQKPPPARLIRLLMIELALMILVNLFWQFSRDLNQLIVVAIAAVAMGLQSAIAGSVALKGVSTVAITNTITSAIRELVNRLRNRHIGSWRTHPVVFLVIDWSAYFVGALLGALGFKLRFELPFALPTVLLAIVVVLVLRMRRLTHENQE